MLAASWKLWRQPLEKKQLDEDERQYGENLLTAAEQELSEKSPVVLRKAPR